MLPYAPPPVQAVPAEVRIAQNAAAVCPKLATPQKGDLAQQAINLLSETKCRLDIELPIVTKTNRDKSTTYSFDGRTFFQINLPQNPNDKISIIGLSSVLNAIKETLNKPGAELNGRKLRGLAQEILLTPEQLSKLDQKREQFSQTLLKKEQEREQSAAPTLPEGLTPEQVPDFLKFATAFLNQSKTQ